MEFCIAVVMLFISPECAQLITHVIKESKSPLSSEMCLEEQKHVGLSRAERVRVLVAFHVCSSYVIIIIADNGDFYFRSRLIEIL